MRKDWIRTEEERELRRLKNLTKQQRKLNKLSSEQTPTLNFPIVARKKKRILPLPTQPVVTKKLVVQKIEPVNIFVYEIFNH
jgi:hypothetical protein